ncbi:MAG: T9SS type A sorting domain-containing protein [Saprospiraceae bacterium]|nr:T9SS type A sorting domain-containing protein [Saprospiraceae bacterium]MCO5276992.1 T9SS type A sorting domain-containing protein [Saprospiraceae bacterium]
MNKSLSIKYLLYIGILVLPNAILSQNQPLAGVPVLTSYNSSRHLTETTYSLPTGMTYDSLDLTDIYYLEPTIEDWTLLYGKDATGTDYFISQNRSILDDNASLGYKISHLVTHDSITEIYDIHNNLIRRSYQSISSVPVPDTDTSGEWQQVIQLNPGVIKYIYGTYEMTQDINTGNVFIKRIDSKGREIRIFEQHNVSNQEITTLNYRLTTIPIITPTGLCVTKLISEIVTERVQVNPQNRMENNKFRPKLFLSIFPNPTQSFITISLSSNIDLPCYYSVIDMRGQIIVNPTEMNQKEKNVDISTLPHGIYILQVSTHAGIITEKFIKQ